MPLKKCNAKNAKKCKKNGATSETPQKLRNFAHLILRRSMVNGRNEDFCISLRLLPLGMTAAENLAPRNNGACRASEFGATLPPRKMSKGFINIFSEKFKSIQINSEFRTPDFGPNGG
jgi:hypothetical protein